MEYVSGAVSELDIQNSKEKPRVSHVPLKIQRDMRYSRICSFPWNKRNDNTDKKTRTKQNKKSLAAADGLGLCVHDVNPTCLVLKSQRTSRLISSHALEIKVRFPALIQMITNGCSYAPSGRSLHCSVSLIHRYTLIYDLNARRRLNIAPDKRTKRKQNQGIRSGQKYTMEHGAKNEAKVELCSVILGLPLSAAPLPLPCFVSGEGGVRDKEVATSALT